MRHWLYLFIVIFSAVMSRAVNAWAAVSVQQAGHVLKIQVKPYSPLNPYESWYKVRRDSDGNRFGQRQFWMNDDQHERYYSFKNVCENSVNAGVLDFELNLKTLNSKEMWAKFNCLRLHADAMAIVYPDLVKFLTPQMNAVSAVAKEFNDVAMKFDFKAADYQLTADASNALQALVNNIMNANYISPWIKNSNYREALLKGTLKEFNKKRWAGNDSVITKPFVLVTHATTIFDDKTIKKYADQIISEAKAKNLPVVYLASDDGVHDQTWYLADKNPDRVYFSKNGEHSVLFSSQEVVLMGGFYSQCLRTSQLDTITRHFLMSERPLTIHLPVQGIYAHDSIDFTKLSKSQFLERVKEGSILGGYEVDDNHGGLVESDMNKLTGVPDLKQYTVNIFADGELLEKAGSGPRVVHLKFWSQSQFLNFLDQ